MSKKINLGIIFGGKSGEHEVSLRSANQVISALDQEKYNIIPIAITKNGRWLLGDLGDKYMSSNLLAASEESGISEQQSEVLVEKKEEKRLTNFIQASDQDLNIDLVMPIGHGPYMEDGKLQGMLEMAGIPYLFSDVLANALAMNKPKTKIIAKSSSVPVAKSLILKKGKKYNSEKIVAKFQLPIVIKPSELGSSVGISIATTIEELNDGIEKALVYGSEVMLEQFVKGRELTVAVIGNEHPKALPVVEIIPRVSGWFDYQAKYQSGGSKEICPANIPDEISKKVQRYSIRVFKALGCRDLARADFIWSEQDGKIYFLEINTIPGMTATSLAPQAAKAAGMDFPRFLDFLISNALKRTNKR